VAEEIEVKRSVCHWCKGECGVLVHVKDGRMIKLEADPDWPRVTYPTPNGCGRLKYMGYTHKEFARNVHYQHKIQRWKRDDDPDVCNQLTGTWQLKTVLCKVYKVKKY
jgi:hypothetical protein